MYAGLSRLQETLREVSMARPTGFEPVTYGLEESRALNNTL